MLVHLTYCIRVTFLFAFSLICLLCLQLLMCCLCLRLASTCVERLKVFQAFKRIRPGNLPGRHHEHPLVMCLRSAIEFWCNHVLCSVLTTPQLTWARSLV
jgi:hypothetical protein